MNVENLKVLQLGKFYPIRGGVEKVAFDLMKGLSERGIECHMLCAAEEGEDRIILLNEHAQLICTHTWVKACATMISPSMIFTLRKICGKYDIIHVHHPDPMACLALFLSGYKGKVVLHWHSDIQKQKMLLKLYYPLQQWLLKRADVIVGTSPVYLAESPFLQHVQHKTVCLPIGVEPMQPVPEAVKALRSEYPGKKIVFSLGRLVAYKGYRFLVEAAQYLKDGIRGFEGRAAEGNCFLEFAGKGETIRESQRRGTACLLRSLRCILHEQCAENRSVWYCADRSNVVRKACGSYQNTSVRSVLGE